MSTTFDPVSAGNARAVRLLEKKLEAAEATIKELEQALKSQSKVKHTK